MQLIRNFLLVLLAGMAINSAPAQAETFHTCGNVIASLPAVITSQGVYCLTHDVATAMTSGYAIDIQTNNVTIDCNGYKIGGLAAGNSSFTDGIHASNTRQNITVRNCGIRGFFEGIFLQGGAGHLIEDNRLDNNLYFGISVVGDNNRVQRNRVYDTGGATGMNISTGILANADVIDNTVAGVFATATNTTPYGIVMNSAGIEARGNQVRGLVVAGSGAAYGIYADGSNQVRVDGNHISASAATNGVGIAGDGVTNTFCVGNTIGNFSTAVASCQESGDLSH